MLAGLFPASIPDLGVTVPKDWWTMYRFMFVGLSFSIISDLGPALAQDWPANLSIYVYRPIYRSVLTGQCVDLCWLACLLPVSLILVSPTHGSKEAGQCTNLCWPACLPPVFSDIGPTAPGLPAGS